MSTHRPRASVLKHDSGRWKPSEKWYLESDAGGVYFKIENFKAG